MLKYLFILGFACLVFAKNEFYEGFGVYDVEVNSPEQISVLKSLKEDWNLDIWAYPNVGRNGKILVPPTLKANFQDALFNAGIKYNLDVDNVKEQLDLEDALLSEASKKPKRASDGGLSFDQIHTFEVVSDYLDELAQNYPNLVSVGVAGQSVEGRDIKYIKISTTNFQDTSKPVVYVQSLLHAREWVTLPVTLYAIKRLVHDVTDQSLVDNLDWIIMPVANPDGYVFSHGDSNRFWRKNRKSNNLGSFCIGVDLNRNFDVNWGTASSSFPCAEDFHGNGPFSEPETSAIRDLLAIYGNRIDLFLDIHSFGSMILYGYGNGTLPSNVFSIHTLGINQAQAIDAVKWPNKRNYIVGNIALTLYQASGGCSDYGHVVGAPYSYTYELPGFNNIQGLITGFLVDPDFIEQAGFETWEGIKRAASYVANRRSMDLQNLQKARLL